MTNPVCEVCGHVSRLGAASCELCDTPFVAAQGAAGPFGAYARAGAAGDAFAHGAGPLGFDDEGARAGALPTDIPSPRFLGVGDAFSPTLRVYREHFVLVGQLVLATTLPLAFLQCVAYLLIRSDEWAGGVSGPGVWSFAVTNGAVGGAIYWLLTVVGNAVLAGALAYAVVELQRRGTAPRAGDCLRWGLSKMFKVIAVSLLGIVLMYVVPLCTLLMVVAIFDPLVFFLSLVVLLLPWIALVLTISLAVPAASVENRGVFESFRRSAELTRGFKGLLFLTYFLWFLLISGLSIVMMWSFSYGGELSLTGLILQTLVGAMLSSSTTVLTLYIFLGVLNERRQSSAPLASAQAPVI